MLRSPFCGVPSGVAAAYATLWAREGNLLDSIGRQRLACDVRSREALLGFAAALTQLSRLPADSGLAQRRAAIANCFALDCAPPTHAADAGERAEFALAEPVSPEAGAGIATDNPRFSASQLNTYAECPRKWFYRYLCAAVEDKGSSASFYGTAFHAALERFHAEYPQPGNVQPRELDSKLQGYLNAAFERHSNDFETPVERELQVRRARRTARKYVEWLVAQARLAPFTVVGCEIPAELQIEGFDFIGYIDRLDRDDATAAVTVIDYKTGSIAATAAEYRDKVRRFKDFQLPFYYWARSAQGDRVTRLALVPLRDALLDVRPISLEVIPIARETTQSHGVAGVIPISELERARERMVQICRELTCRQAEAFPVTDDPAACTYCSYSISCAYKPYPREERFAR